jgi:hypothetical protein
VELVMKKQILFSILSLLASATLLFGASSAKWMKEQYVVQSVSNSDQFSVEIDGKKQLVKLAFIGVEDDAGAKEYLTKLLVGKKVIIIPEESVGLTEDGCLQIYGFLIEDGKKTFINQAMIEEGLAKYVPGVSEEFKKLLTVMAEAKSKAPQNVALKVDGKLYSEAYSKMYHALGCRWQKLINNQSSITFESFEEAEKAGKSPCGSCLYERLKLFRANKI